MDSSRETTCNVVPANLHPRAGRFSVTRGRGDQHSACYLVDTSVIQGSSQTGRFFHSFLNDSFYLLAASLFLSFSENEPVAFLLHGSLPCIVFLSYQPGCDSLKRIDHKKMKHIRKQHRSCDKLVSEILHQISTE